MVTAPRITVITVTLNAADDLPLTLESVLCQTYPHIETLLVDGCSWDNTHTVLNRYRDRLDNIMMLEDGGIYQAMNAAVQVATGDYVLFLNAGDRFYGAGTVEAVVTRMAGQPDVVYGDHIYVEGRVERLVRSANFDWLWQRLEQGRIDQKWHTAIPCHQATFTRTRWLRDMPYDTRYAICADHDFLFRAQAAGARMQYVDEIVCHYLAGGMSGVQGVRIHREWAHAYRKHSLRPLAVDSFFFGTPQGSPFPAFSGASGALMSGVTPEIRQDPEGRRWRWANELTLISPKNRETVGIEIRGSCLAPDQTMIATQGQDLLCAERLPSGGFATRMAFIAPLAPDHEIALGIRMPKANSTAQVWGLEALYFIPCAVLAGKGLNILASDPEQVADIFVDGWSAIEWLAEGEDGDGRSLVWSDIEQASLALSLPAPAKTLTLHVEGHPAAPKAQMLSLVINGIIAGSIQLDTGSGPRPYRFAVDHAWRKGANIIRLCLDNLAYDTDRRRWFGLGLSRLEWE